MISINNAKITTYIVLSLFTVIACRQKTEGGYEENIWRMIRLSAVIEECKNKSKYPNTIISLEYTNKNSIHGEIIPPSMPFLDYDDPFIKDVVRNKKYLRYPEKDTYSVRGELPYVVYYFDRGFFIVSAGPDHIYDLPNGGTIRTKKEFDNYRGQYIYDPTNGMDSRGDIIYPF